MVRSPAGKSVKGYEWTLAVCIRVQ